MTHLIRTLSVRVCVCVFFIVFVLLSNSEKREHLKICRNVDCVPSSETQGQAVGSREKARRKFSCRGESSPVLENFRRAFYLDPTDCPWVSEDDCVLANHNKVYDTQANLKTTN